MYLMIATSAIFKASTAPAHMEQEGARSPQDTARGRKLVYTEKK